MTVAIKSHWAIAALIASAAMLAGAHAFEAFGYRPCALCMRQREVYWAVIAISVIGLIAPRLWKSPFLPRAICALLGGAFLVGAAVAIFHAGVEWKFWPGPTTCSSVHTGGALTADDIAKALGSATKVTACDEAAWRDPVVKLSMAGWNALVSLALAGLSFVAAATPIARQDND